MSVLEHAPSLLMTGRVHVGLKTHPFPASSWGCKRESSPDRGSSATASSAVSVFWGVSARKICFPSPSCATVGATTQEDRLGERSL